METYPCTARRAFPGESDYQLLCTFHPEDVADELANQMKQTMLPVRMPPVLMMLHVILMRILNGWN